MSTIYLVTGAAGHLGSTVIRLLHAAGLPVRALVLPGDRAESLLSGLCSICHGDVLDPDSLSAFFSMDAGDDAIVIHCAGIVSIASRYQQRVYDVNVTGTKNIVTQCLSHPVRRLIYVSSVHAIPEQPKGHIISETDHFDEEAVQGLYAKTKAAATASVLDAVRAGLDACVVHPSGICGPYDAGAGHLTQLFIDYYRGSLTAGVSGGYDFVDVRDVAAGILSCCVKGHPGTCYILSNRYFSIPEVLECFHQVSGKKRVKTILPIWFAKLTAPLSEIYYKILRQPPLYTAYSLYTLTSNAVFSHERASQQLGYNTRPFEETIRDTMEWLREQHRI